jgi:carboxylesterase
VKLTAILPEPPASTSTSVRATLADVSDTYPVQPYAEPWSSKGEGAHARIGIVVSHGFTGNPSSVRPLGEGLAALGFRVEVPRLPGHGTDVRDMGRTRYADWRGAIADARDRLAKECDAVVLSGLSMGGTIVLDLAGAEPDRIAGAVAINPALLDREGLLAKLAPYVSWVVPRVPASAAGLTKNDIAAGGDEHAYEAVPTKAANSLVAAFPRIRTQLRGCKVPLLVVYSKQDHSVPPANSLAIPDLVGAGGNVEMLALERSYHVATLDHDLELIVERTAKFAEAVAGRRKESKPAEKRSAAG